MDLLSYFPVIGKYVVIPLIIIKGAKYLRREYLLSRKPLKGKVVLITGASSGLGEALAEVLCDAGCVLILAARRVDQLERVRDKLTRAGQVPPKVLELDLADLDELPRKAHQALRLYGRIDVLINNGGMSYRGIAAETSIDVDKQLMLVNYFGQVALTKVLLPSMRKRKKGFIVTISSVQGKLAIPFRSAYAASKHALQAFFDTLRSEVAADNVQVCVVSPGYIKTNLSLNAMTGDGSNYGRMDATTSSGMDPLHAAKLIYAAIICNEKELVLAPVTHKLAIILRAVCPWIFFLIGRYRART